MDEGPRAGAVGIRDEAAGEREVVLMPPSEGLRGQLEWADSTPGGEGCPPPELGSDPGEPGAFCSS